MRIISVIILGFLLVACAKKEATRLPSTVPLLVTALEDIAKLERKEEVLAFWQNHGWKAQPELRETLVRQGFKIPDHTYYPFVERYGAPILLTTSGRQAILQIYLDGSGWVTYRTIEVINIKP
jgi:hypothetical protein